MIFSNLIKQHKPCISCRAWFFIERRGQDRLSSAIMIIYMGNNTLSRWLPIIFGCHQKPERSFFYHGKQFPLCARCTGELVGISSGVILFWFWKPCLAISVSIMIPMLIDGFVQRLTPYESTNARRFITGFLFGLGLASIFLVSVSSTFANGYRYGLEIGKNIKK